MTTRLTVWGTNGRINVDRQECQIYLREKVPALNELGAGWTTRYTTDLSEQTWFYLRGEEYSAQIDYFIQAVKAGRTENVLMRIADIQLSFPPILIALVLLALLGQGLGKIIAALVTVQWAYYARTVRGAALVERRKEYIEAAQVLALPPARIVFRHLLPNCMPPLIVIATVQVASAITLEATLSFLGLGLPITEPSLGLLIANGFNYLLSGKYWISMYPGVALVLMIVSINLVADQLRDVINPRLQK